MDKPSVAVHWSISVDQITGKDYRLLDLLYQQSLKIRGTTALMDATPNSLTIQVLSVVCQGEAASDAIA